MGRHPLINQQHLSGQAAELFVAFTLTDMGYTVSKPWLTQCRYDLVVEMGGLFWSLQIKKATWSKSGPFKYLQARLSRDKTRLDPQVDFFAFTDNKQVWMVEAIDLKGMTSVCLGSSNPQYKAYTKYDAKEWIIDKCENPD